MVSLDVMICIVWERLATCLCVLFDCTRDLGFGFLHVWGVLGHASKGNGFIVLLAWVTQTEGRGYLEVNTTLYYVVFVAGEKCSVF
jgi:hypothetical protein